MARPFIAVLVLCLSAGPAAAQWAKAYGTPEGREEATAVRATGDGGFIVCGRMECFSPSGYPDGDRGWVFKIDAAGHLVWQQAQSYRFAERRSILGTPDGGCIVAGTRYLHDECPQGANVVRFAADGSWLWEHENQGYSTRWSPDWRQAFSLAEGPSGNYIAAGRHWSGKWPDGNEVLVLSITANGDKEWAHTFGGPGDDYGACIRPTRDGHLVVAGSTDSFGVGGRDAWVLKLSNTGRTVLWQWTYGGPGEDYAESIEPTRDGGYLVAGVTKSFGSGDYDAWVLKLDSLGFIQWQKTYGGPRDDYAHEIRTTPDGHFVIAGSTRSFGAEELEAWLIKLDAAGDILWQKMYGGLADESGFSIDVLRDGFVLAGRTRSYGTGKTDVLVLRLDANGDLPGVPRLVKSTRAVPIPSPGSMEWTTVQTVPDLRYGSRLDYRAWSPTNAVSTLIGEVTETARPLRWWRR